jgi:hypothetical protein
MPQLLHGRRLWIRLNRRCSSDNPAVKPAKEEAKIRVGNPISPVASKPIEPIRVEEKKPPKKPKRRGKGRDEGPSM